METLKNLPVLLFDDQKAWRQWLNVNHDQEIGGIWLKIAKKASGKHSVSYLEALDDALCFGWIDSQKRSYDDKYFLQKFCPRRSKSIWSKVNVDKINALTAAGKMEAAGLAAVKAAKLDGRWDQAYDSHSTITMPQDFRAALDNNPVAKEFYESLNKTNTYAYLWRLQTTKTLSARKSKIDKFITMLNKREKFH